MKTETEVNSAGMRALIAALCEVDAEHFVALVQRERFDYTAWRRDGLPDTSLEQLHQAATAGWVSKGA